MWARLSSLGGLAVLLLLVPVAAAAPRGERIGRPLEDARIEVSKARRQLRLYSGGALLRSYRIGLGFSPLGHKSREGDGATPEGEYFVCVKNPRSRFYLSLGINYPNAADAERGLNAGLLSRAQTDRILEAARRRRPPPWNTALGGEIFIHGRGAGSDWTRGCIALDDRDMKELYSAAQIGTPVLIEP